MKRKILYLILFLVSILCNINVFATDKYDGEYTIDYLIRNYNLVTLGTNDNDKRYGFLNSDVGTRGSVINVFDIGGPVLIRGDYKGETNLKWDNEFAQKTNGIPSYIKGKIGDRIKAGSIESADISNIYVGSSNNVIKVGDNYKVNNDTYLYPYEVKVSDDYLDFDKLYTAIMEESKKVPKGTNLNDTNINNLTPGYYYIDDVNFFNKTISIPENGGTYIFTSYDEYISEIPSISGVSMTGTEVYCDRMSTSPEISGKCKTTVIWNFPYAKFIKTSDKNQFGHIIAPRAHINLRNNNYPGTVIANSVSSHGISNSYTGLYVAVQYHPYLGEKLNFNGQSINERKEISSDIYDGDYTIEEMLKGYSVITLGQKEYSPKSKIANYTKSKGSASIFHIVGPMLINGDLGVDDGKHSYIRLDFEFNKLNNFSYIHNLKRNAEGDVRAQQRFANSFLGSNFTIDYFSVRGTSEAMKEKSSTYLVYVDEVSEKKNLPYRYTSLPTVITKNNYIDFKILYDTIVQQQKKIIRGDAVSVNDKKVAEIPIGGNYHLSNVSDINKIKFTNFSDNNEKVTVITIEDEGDIVIPVVGSGSTNSDSVSNVFTNDYFGGETNLGDWQHPIQYYDSYHGNIIWNIPNATHITLTKESPFIGHIIAPNADVETPELHFAGAMIVNSLYTEGNTEAHFYPLTLNLESIFQEETLSINVSKVWKDNNNKQGLRPENVSVDLLSDGKKIASIELNEKNDWKYTFKDLPVSKDDKKIEYTIQEGNIKGYKSNITGTVESGFTITNSLIIDNPPTLDNQNIFIMIFMVSSLLFTSSIIIYIRFKREA